MKKTTIFILLFFAYSVSFSQSIKKVKITDVAKMIDTSSTPLVINIWATWCAPCVHEIPWFEKQVTELKDTTVQLILVSVDFRTDYPKKLENFVREKGYKSKILWLEETDASYFCPFIDKDWDGNIPVTLMVNNKKKYRQFYNSQITEPRLKLELQKLLE